jgi:hypothetical protein
MTIRFHWANVPKKSSFRKASVARVDKTSSIVHIWCTMECRNNHRIEGQN